MRAVAQPVAEARVAAGLGICWDSARVPGAQAVPRLSRAACIFAGTTQLSLAPGFFGRQDGFLPLLFIPFPYESTNFSFCALILWP